MKAGAIIAIKIIVFFLKFVNQRRITVHASIDKGKWVKVFEGVLILIRH